MKLKTPVVTEQTACPQDINLSALSEFKRVMQEDEVIPQPVKNILSQMSIENISETVNKLNDALGGKVDVPNTEH